MGNEVWKCLIVAECSGWRMTLISLRLEWTRRWLEVYPGFDRFAPGVVAGVAVGSGSFEVNDSERFCECTFKCNVRS